MKTSPQWFVYMLECSDGTLYTGTTNDVPGRIATHNSGKGAKYTRGRGPVRLLYTEELVDRSSALKREAEIKQLSKEAKRKLILRRQN